jgi:curli biogenesis system outer membrane secretion channel CsgG
VSIITKIDIPLLCKEGKLPLPLWERVRERGKRSPSPLLSHQGRGELVHVKQREASRVCLSAFIIFITFSINTWAAAPLSNLSKQGPKVRVAVANFGTTDRFASVYGGWNIGGGLSAQLVTELIKTGRVVVVERAILSKVLMEQELGESQLLSPLTKMPPGHLLGVDYLIVGEVTEFEEKQMGAGMGAKIFGVKFGGDVSAAHVGMDLRIVDTRTGEILYSHRSQGKAWDKAIGAKFDYKILDFGGDAFHKTPLGKATRSAIDDAVGFILGVIDKQVEEYTWLARVIEIEGDMIYFNAGNAASISPGDRFRVSAVRKVLTDPETNQVIGLVENELGVAVAVIVDRRYTKARVMGGFRPRVGDIIRFADHKLEEVAQHEESPVGYQVME